MLERQTREDKQGQASREKTKNRHKSHALIDFIMLFYDGFYKIFGKSIILMFLTRAGI